MLNGSIWTQNSFLPFKRISFLTTQSKAPKILWAFKGFFFSAIRVCAKGHFIHQNGALSYCINVQHWLSTSSLLSFLLTVVFEGCVLALLHLMKLLDRMDSEHRLHGLILAPVCVDGIESQVMLRVCFSTHVHSAFLVSLSLLSFIFVFTLNR